MKRYMKEKKLRPSDSLEEMRNELVVCDQQTTLRTSYNLQSRVLRFLDLIWIQATKYVSFQIIKRFDIPGMQLDHEAQLLLQQTHFQEKHNRCGMWKPRDHYLRNTRVADWQVSSLAYSHLSASSQCNNILQTSDTGRKCCCLTHSDMIRLNSNPFHLIEMKFK